LGVLVRTLILLTSILGFVKQIVAVPEKSDTAPRGVDIESDTALLQITEYEQTGYPRSLRFPRRSGTMGLGDALGFAVSLSYSFGEYVSLISSDPCRKSILRVVVRRCPLAGWTALSNRRLLALLECPRSHPDEGAVWVRGEDGAGARD
jgi:hypothetical protein